VRRRRPKGRAVVQLASHVSFMERTFRRPWRWGMGDATNPHRRRPRLP
jgi:hypothetical protein